VSAQVDTESWTARELRQALSASPEVKGWIVTEEVLTRRERYFLAGAEVDQDREARAHSIQARIFVRLSDPKRQGEISKKFFPALPLGPQVTSAVAGAKLSSTESWELPTELPKSVPVVRSADPGIAEDVDRAMESMTKEVRDAVSELRHQGVSGAEARFGSGELFVSLHERELTLSNGLSHRSLQTRVYAEAAYVSKHGERGDEYLKTAWSVGREGISIPELFRECRDASLGMLKVRAPVAGRYSVIVDTEVLSLLFSGIVSQLTAQNAYHKLPFVEVGGAIVPEAGPGADRITLRIDPSLDLGADAVALSSAGVVQRPLTLIEQGRVVATASDPQYAAYTSRPVSTTRGDVVVSAGTRTHDELTREADQVLEILQFSALFADANTGTFSSEIRLAKLYDRKTGEVEFIKGGSLSGSITENFRGLRLSSETCRYATFSSDSPVGRGYHGPKYALLTDVTVSS